MEKILEREMDTKLRCRFERIVYYSGLNEEGGVLANKPEGPTGEGGVPI